MEEGAEVMDEGAGGVEEEGVAEGVEGGGGGVAGRV